MLTLFAQFLCAINRGIQGKTGHPVKLHQVCTSGPNLPGDQDCLALDVGELELLLAARLSLLLTHGCRAT